VQLSLVLPSETNPGVSRFFGHGHDGGHHQFIPRIIYATIFQ
jgi:hypothetical protein